MFNAVQAREVSGDGNKSMERYLSARIKESATAGFSTTKAWVDSNKLEVVDNVLVPNGYTYEVVHVDADRSQISISW